MAAQRQGVSNGPAGAFKKPTVTETKAETAELEPFLVAYGVTDLEPEPALLEQAEAVCIDPDDAPILAAALQSAELYGAVFLLSNDFETFHTPG